MRIATVNAWGLRRSGGTAKAVAGVVAALCCLAAAVPAAAGQDPGIRVGYYTGADAEDPVPTVGVYGRIDVPGPVNIEIAADARREELQAGDLESTVIPLRVSAVLNLFPVVGPYLIAGVGAAYNRITFHHGFSGRDAEDSLLTEAHAGLGLQFDLGPVNLIGDVRYCASQKVSSAAVRSALGRDYDPSGWHASLGLGFSF